MMEQGQSGDLARAGARGGLRGTYVALATPMTRGGAVDEPRLRDLVEFVVAGGVDGLVPTGTTGESPTLDHVEHGRAIEIVIEAAAGRCPVMAGTGSNSTAEAIQLSSHAREAGATSCLQVAPYYNKPTQEGLYRHFRAIAEAVDLPHIIYNIPGRCGVAVEVSTLERMSEVPNIIGVKEAGGSVDRVSALVARTSLDILSGDDSLTLPMMAVGARGVISVAANVAPARVAAMVRAAEAGDWAAARRLHLELWPLFRDLFLETNPIPVKAALAMMGRAEEVYRLPLCPMAGASRAQLQTTLRGLGVID